MEGRRTETVGVVAILYGVLRAGFSKKVMFEQNPEEGGECLRWTRQHMQSSWGTAEGKQG